MFEILCSYSLFYTNYYSIFIGNCSWLQRRRRLQGVLVPSSYSSHSFLNFPIIVVNLLLVYIFNLFSDIVDEFVHLQIMLLRVVIILEDTTVMNPFLLENWDVYATLPSHCWSSQLSGRLTGCLGSTPCWITM